MVLHPPRVLQNLAQVKADLDLDPPKGHLEPLGSHGPPRREGIREVWFTDEDPVPISPPEFWRNHVEPHLRHKETILRHFSTKVRGGRDGRFHAVMHFSVWDEASAEDPRVVGTRYSTRRGGDFSSK